jgi:hypothetical protein
MAYYELHGLNHVDGIPPSIEKVMNVVAYKEEEDNMVLSMYHYYIELFFKYNVKELTGLTIEEFLDLTVEETNELLEFCREEIDLRSKELDALNNAGGNKVLGNDIFGNSMF